MNLNDVKTKLSKKLKNSNLYQKWFGFENGVDLSNDAQVLHRKNIVIKHIILLSNAIYTLIFTFISIGDSSNWILTIVLFPVTWFVNMTMTKLINRGSEDELSQKIAMYFASSYMFLSAIIIYIKLSRSSQVYLKESGYILLYYSLLICSFYQDKVMLKNVNIVVLIVVTILHVTITYDIVGMFENKSPIDAFAEFFSSKDFRDLILRTIILGLYMLVSMIFVSMTNHIQDERKKELVKRREVEKDFSDIILDIFDSSIKEEPKNMMEIGYMNIVAEMVRKLAGLYNLPKEEQDKIYDFSLVTINNDFDFNIDDALDVDEKYKIIKDKTSLWIELIKRNNIERECETILRATFEKMNDDQFKLSHSMVNEPIDLQIVLLCEIYVTLRRPDKRYKNAYSESGAITFMNDNIKYYFNPNLFDRFITYQSDFDQIYIETNN